MADDHAGDHMTYEEAEANRRDPVWGDPVNQLMLHAFHWIDCAIALHPERIEEFHRLQERVERAAGENITGWDPGRPGQVRPPSTDGEIVLALEMIVDVMRTLAAFTSDASSRH